MSGVGEPLRGGMSCPGATSFFGDARLGLADVLAAAAALRCFAGARLGVAPVRPCAAGFLRFAAGFLRFAIFALLFCSTNLAEKFPEHAFSRTTNLAEARNRTCNALVCT